MEFRFSCKWFEIAFSGDPGFIESQLEKYEPFILKALTQVEMELSAGSGTGEEPVFSSPEGKESESDKPPAGESGREREESSGPREQTERGAGKSESGHGFPRRRRTPRIRAEELRALVEEKKPRTHHDRLMVFGYYMETSGGGSDFTVGELKRCYRAVGEDPGISVDQVMVHAARSGFVVSSGQGRGTRYKLSPKGKRYVEDGLKLS